MQRNRKIEKKTKKKKQTKKQQQQKKQTTTTTKKTKQKQQQQNNNKKQKQHLNENLLGEIKLLLAIGSKTKLFRLYAKCHFIHFLWILSMHKLH